MVLLLSKIVLKKTCIKIILDVSFEKMMYHLKNGGGLMSIIKRFICLFFIFVFCMGYSGITDAQERHTKISRPVIWQPQIIVRSNYKPMVIEDLFVKTNIIGNVATTTYEMIIRNPNSATLEAEFVFPMSENQTVAAVALDINGKMREGVVVEKEKARQTFEAVVRQNADPLLVEKVSGNQFKTRIYPFTPNGTRRIRIVLEESLNKNEKNYFYELPLTLEQKLSHFSLDIEIPTESNELPEVSTNIEGFKFTKEESVIRSHFEAQDYDLNHTLSFELPVPDTMQIFTHTARNRTYFYTTMDVPKSVKDKKLPKNLAVLWDVSLSGANRDIKREKEILLSYLKKIKNIDVSFVLFNIEQQNVQKFSIKNGEITAIEKYIDEIVYDGATQFKNLKLDKLNVDEFMLFTDGVSTYAKDDDLVLPSKPLFIINSSKTFEPERLKGWADQTLGAFINLNTMDEIKALDKLTHESLRIVKYTNNNISEVYPVMGTEVNGNINISGILKGGQGNIEIQLGYNANDIVKSQKVEIQKGGDNSAVARLWAVQKINYLEQNAKKNKQEILKLGQLYSIVTDNTSLLVLENASDYWRYHINPPDDLRAEYDRLQKNFDKKEHQKKDSALNEALSMAQHVKEWWQKSFDIKLIKQQKYEQLKAQNSVQNLERRATGYIDEDGHVVVDGGTGSVSDYEADWQDTLTGDTSAGHVYDGDGHVLGRASSESSLTRSYSGSLAVSADAKMVPANSVPQGKIQVKPWDPDTPYLKILKASKDNELYSDYLKLKTGYVDQPSFYFDIVDEFIRRGQKDQALIVLSNILEMQLDNVELIRIVANKLLQMNDTSMAVELFEKITELRGEDPQSFRDLALAYQEDGQYQKAFDTFYQIMQKQWARFNEIKQIVFVEMNNLLALHSEIDTKDINKEFIFPMPVDIRIVLGWSTDNTDIDLHVIDPLNEECYYNHKKTQIGGRYTHDFTQGFGPEEFMLKKAANGKYIIRTNNFGDHRQSISGPSTLYLDIYTNYGQKNQTKERLLIRAGQVKDKNEIGDIIWSGNTDEEE